MEVEARAQQQGGGGPPPPAGTPGAQPAAAPDDPWLLAMGDALDAFTETRADLSRAQAENGELKGQLQAAQALAERQARQLTEAEAGRLELQRQCNELTASVDQHARQLAEGEAERGRLAQELQREAEGAARLKAEAGEYRGRYERMVELLRQRGVRPRE